MDKTSLARAIMNADLITSYLTLLFNFIGCIAVIAGMVVLIKRSGIGQGAIAASITSLSDKFDTFKETITKKTDTNCAAIKKAVSNIEGLREYTVKEFQLIDQARFVTHEQHYIICNRKKDEDEKDMDDLKSTVKAESDKSQQIFNLLTSIDGSVKVLVSEMTNIKEGHKDIEQRVRALETR